MADIIKTNYPAMEAMARSCREAADKLQETINLLNNIASQLDGGAMQGSFGERYSNALRNQGVKSLQKLVTKFNEESSDILAAKQDMQNADNQAAGGFR